jgi:hypothetical protein
MAFNLRNRSFQILDHNPVGPGSYEGGVSDGAT